jgi:hypothetical protein
MSIACSVLEKIAGEVANRCSADSIPWTLRRLRGIQIELRSRPHALAMLVPGEGRKPVRLVEAMRAVADLIREPGRVEEVRQTDVATILMVTAALEGALAARLMAAERDGAVTPSAEPEPDRLLNVHEASRLLSISEDFLYRHAKTLPFVVRPTPGTLRFSAREIGRFLRRKQAKIT